MRFGEKAGPWFKESSILASSHDTFYVWEMTSKTFMLEQGRKDGTFHNEVERGKIVKWGGRSVEEQVEGVDRIAGLVARLRERWGGENTSGSTERIFFVLYEHFRLIHCIRVLYIAKKGAPGYSLTKQKIDQVTWTPTQV